MTNDKSNIRVWCIGPDGTEYYAAHSEEEMRDFYVGLVGKEEAERDLAEHFEEVPQAALDVEFQFDEDGNKIMTTWRKLIDSAITIPTQISTGYN